MVVKFSSSYSSTLKIRPKFRCRFYCAACIVSGSMGKLSLSTPFIYFVNFLSTCFESNDLPLIPCQNNARTMNSTFDIFFKTRETRAFTCATPLTIDFDDHLNRRRGEPFSLQRGAIIATKRSLYCSHSC